MEFLLLAEAVPASRALALGLLNEVVPSSEVLPRAFEWAERILVNGPLAVRATKESVVRGMSGTLRDAYRIESELSQVVFASEDAKEGPAAFAEKREPRWQNR
jgi:enoyl-CoA hydratase